MEHPTKAVEAWLEHFSDALTRCHPQAAAALFHEECYWRDLLTFTWNIKTMEGRDAVRDMLAATLDHAQPVGWVISAPPTAGEHGVEAWLHFETAVARGEAVLRLRDGKCHTLFTAMTELKGFEEQRGRTRPLGVRHQADPQRVTWTEERRREQENLGVTEQPYTVIIGGGQGGMALGARLKQLGVPTIILDKHPRAGDAWRTRYRTLVLHDPIWFDHLPYIPFPDHWPVFTPKDKLADWMEMYALVMELNYWTSSTCQKASYDPKTQRWTVEVDRNGERVVLHPAQLVFATGGNGPANAIAFEDMDRFSGAILHSSQYAEGALFQGRKVAVIGSGSSGHDICVDLWENGADVTMVQRSSSTVVRIGTMQKVGLPIYSEEAIAAGITTERADMITASLPFREFTRIQQGITAQLRTLDADFYKKLEAAGFLLDFGEDDSGMVMKAYRTGSGYYIDVGGSDLIINGDVKLKSGQAVERLDEKGIIFADGSRLDVDVIIACTGYRSILDVVGQIVSPEVAEAMGGCAGLGSGVRGDPGPWKGEMRNLWKPTNQPALWFMTGNLALSRFYSRILALQLKARMDGLETPVYGEPG